MIQGGQLIRLGIVESSTLGLTAPLTQITKSSHKLNLSSNAIS